MNWRDDENPPYSKSIKLLIHSALTSVGSCSCDRCVNISAGKSKQPLCKESLGWACGILSCLFAISTDLRVLEKEFSKLSLFFPMYHKQYLDLFFWRFRHPVHSQGIRSCKDWTDDGSGLLGCFCCLVAWEHSLERIFAPQMEEMRLIHQMKRIWLFVSTGAFESDVSGHSCLRFFFHGAFTTTRRTSRKSCLMQIPPLFVLHSLLHLLLLHYGTLLATEAVFCFFFRDFYIFFQTLSWMLKPL